ncbi:MAG: AsmA family protein [Rhodospirillaceae bacterium]|nr:AsmA family protein [Rhodospirillaceae bacterium]MCY4066669.1 AsmA family protein [Rhodospirillaceae bacterium]
MRWILRGAIGLALLAAAVAATAIVLVSATDFTAYRDEIAAAVKRETGREVRIDGRIEQSVLTLSPSISMAGLTFANADWGSRPEMLTAERVELEVALLPLIGGEILVKRFRLTGADLLLETDTAGTANWLFGQADGRQSGPESGADGDGSGAYRPVFPFVKDLEIAASVVTFRDGRSGLETKLRIEQIAARAPTFDSPVNVEARGAYNGVPVAAEGSMGQIAGLFGRVANYPVAAKLQFGRSTLEGAGKADLTGALPVVVGEMKAELLDLDEIAAATAKGRGGPAPSGKSGTPKSGAARQDRPPGLFPRDDLPFGILGLFDARLKVRMKRLVVARNAFDAVGADIVLRKGRLDVDRFSARWTSGSVAGKARFDASSRRPRFTADLRASRIEVGEVLRQALGEPVVRTLAAVTMRISGAGHSIRGIASTLKGPVTVVIGKGPVANRLFDVATTDLLALLAQKPAGIEVVCGAFALRFDGRGLGRGRQLVLDTNRMTFYGQGAVDLGRESMDFRFVPAGKGISLGQFAGLLPISITGRLTRPAVAIEAAAIPKRVASELLGFVTRPFGAAGGENGARRGCGVRKAQAKSGSKEKPAAGGKSGAKRLLDDVKKLNPFR